ncbi:MAG: peptidoglycan DD-metalloendopeptidase family protein [Alphaproteobacteria bacterium]|nr:peptidoglycan DD-metalloendopeptidase family protein [Alphaproteobacteria bacterium]
MKGLKSLAKKAFMAVVGAPLMAFAVAGAAHAQDIDGARGFDPYNAMAQRTANETGYDVTSVHGDVFRPQGRGVELAASYTSAPAPQIITPPPAAPTPAPSVVTIEEPTAFETASVADNGGGPLSLAPAATQVVDAEIPVEELVITMAAFNPHEALTSYTTDTNADYQTIVGLYQRILELSPSLRREDPMKVFMFAHVLYEEDRDIVQQLSARSLQHYRGLLIDGGNILGVAQGGNQPLYDRLVVLSRRGDIAGVLRTGFQAFNTEYLPAFGADALLDNGQYAQALMLSHLAWNRGRGGVQAVRGSHASFADMSAEQIRENAWRAYGRTRPMTFNGNNLTARQLGQFRAAWRDRVDRTFDFGSVFQTAVLSQPAVASVTYRGDDGRYYNVDDNTPVATATPDAGGFQTAGGSFVGFVPSAEAPAEVVTPVVFRPENTAPVVTAPVIATPPRTLVSVGSRAEESSATFVNMVDSPSARYGSGYSLAREHSILRDLFGQALVRPHRGIDIPAPLNSRIRPYGEGVVAAIRTGWNGGFGRQVCIEHSPQVRTCYAHMNRFARGLRVGDRVTADQVIGYVGSDGLADGNHLHFSAEYRTLADAEAGRDNWVFVNPHRLRREISAPVVAETQPQMQLATAEPAPQGFNAFTLY